MNAERPAVLVYRHPGAPAGVLREVCAGAEEDGVPTRVLLLVLTSLLLVGCGKGEDSAEDDVRDVVTRFGEASAKQDYQAICDDLLAPGLVQNVEQYGLPCEIAFKQGIGDVRSPKLELGAVTVKGDSATARVTTTAEGQQPSTDTLALRRAGDEWRISALS